MAPEITESEQRNRKCTKRRIPITYTLLGRLQLEMDFQSSPSVFMECKCLLIGESSSHAHTASISPMVPISPKIDRTDEITVLLKHRRSISSLDSVPWMLTVKYIYDGLVVFFIVRVFRY